MPAGDAPAFKPYTLRATLRGHEGAVAAVKFSCCGAWLASASADRTLRVWRVADGELVATARHRGGVNDCAWSGGGVLASACDDKQLYLWDPASGEQLRALAGHTAYVFCCSFNPQGNQLASGSFDETVRLWEVRTGRCIAVLPAHSDPVTAVAFSHDGTLLVSASYDGLCRLWNPSNGMCLKTLVGEAHPPVSFARFSPNSAFLLLGTLDHGLRLWATQGGCPVRAYAGHAGARFCAAAAFLPSDAALACGGEDGAVRCWHADAAQLLQEVPGRGSADAPGDGHCDAVVALDCHPRERLLATGALDKDRTVKLWQ